MIPTRKLFALVLLSALGCGTGCDKPEVVNSDGDRTVTADEQGPWIKLNEDRISSTGNVLVKDGLGYQVKNERFSELLEVIASQNRINFTVTPTTLLGRGAKAEVTGKDIGEVLADLASVFALKIEKISDTEWAISDGSSEKGPSGRVTMNDW